MPEMSQREQLRAANEALARRRVQRKRLALGAAVVAVVGVTAAAATALANGPSPAATQALPHQVVNVYGVQAGTNPDKVPDGIAVHPQAAKPSAPTVQLFSDYQCPSCKQFEHYFGAELNKLAQTGAIKLEVHPETFLDRLGANKSTDPAIAAACSDVVDAFPAFHTGLYDSQPEREGQGFTRDQLRTEIPGKAGIAGDKLKTFQQCFDNRAMAGFVANANRYNTAYTGHQYETLTAAKDPSAAAWGATPMLSVNNLRLDFASLDINNPASLDAAIAKLAAS